ncbi:hypothetical protein ABT154_31055 [Streptomyces sp. NPDC001728]|uniref:hypothetical protein n=1 Tax=Streptomyces sp. NPDC001728 TaxID=3154396 RepID=UPI00331B7620
MTASITASYAAVSSFDQSCGTSECMMEIPSVAGRFDMSDPSSKVLIILVDAVRQGRRILDRP